MHENIKEIVNIIGNAEFSNKCHAGYRKQSDAEKVGEAVYDEAHMVEEVEE